jgi:hypothetical protein
MERGLGVDRVEAMIGWATSSIGKLSGLIGPSDTPHSRDKLPRVGTVGRSNEEMRKMHLNGISIPYRLILTQICSITDLVFYNQKHHPHRF